MPDPSGTIHISLDYKSANQAMMAFTVATSIVLDKKLMVAAMLVADPVTKDLLECWVECLNECKHDGEGEFVKRVLTNIKNFKDLSLSIHHQLVALEAKDNPLSGGY